MKERKRVFAQFTFHDRTGISRYLENMALKGWMLDKITKWSWHFRRIEPRRIHFAVSYFAKTSSFQPEPPEALLRLREFCKHSGWQFCTEAAQMQIFYNEAEDPVPIETDAMLEIESIHSSIKKQLLPSYVLIGAVAILNGGMHISELIKYPVVFLRSNLNLFVMLSVLCLFLMAAVELGSYFIWRHRALKAAERDGSFLPTRGNRAFILALLIIELALFALLIVSEWNGFVGKTFLVCMGYYVALLLLVHGISDIMKRKKVGAGTNVTVTIILSIVLSFAMLGLMTWTVTRLQNADLFDDKEEEYVLAPDEEYESDIGWIYTLYHHALPLYAEDLWEVDVDYNGDVYSNYRHVYNSILLRYDECESKVRKDLADDGLPSLNYNIIDVKAGFLRDYVFRHYLEKYDKAKYNRIYEYRKDDASLWSADEAYSLHTQNYIGVWDEYGYLLRWDNRIVIIRPSHILTESQIATIVEKLAP